MLIREVPLFRIDGKTYEQAGELKEQVKHYEAAKKLFNAENSGSCISLGISAASPCFSPLAAAISSTVVWFATSVLCHHSVNKTADKANATVAKIRELIATQEIQPVPNGDQEYSEIRWCFRKETNYIPEVTPLEPNRYC